MLLFKNAARAIRTGATRLVVGAIADGQVLTRVGTTIVGAAAGGAVPVKASGAEVTTGTDDAKFVTPKALADAGIRAGEILLATVTGIDLDSTTAQDAYTVPAGKTLITTRVIFSNPTANDFATGSTVNLRVIDSTAAAQIGTQQTRSTDPPQRRLPYPRSSPPLLLRERRDVVGNNLANDGCVGVGCTRRVTHALGILTISV